ncbi:MAG: hypothetical protein QXE76_07770 [Candidatus Bathyarchaeia archaeon]
MGGKKKLSLKQMERMQARKDETKEEKKQSTAPKEKKTYGILPPNVRSESFLNELKKLKVLTPYTVASRFNLRLSVAKDMLEELRQRGTIQFVSASRNLKIYKTPD